MVDLPGRVAGRRPAVAAAQALVPGGDHGQHGAMAFDVDRLLDLWTGPLPEDDETAAAGFRELYTDPVTINGSPMTAVELVGRARVLDQALAQPDRQLLAVVDDGTAVAVAFRMSGLHVGPLDTPAGRVAPTGRRLEFSVMDVLTLTDGLISGIWMVADWLTPLAALGAVRLSPDVGAATS
jgi:predicted ester cyclase